MYKINVDETWRTKKKSYISKVKQRKAIAKLGEVICIPDDSFFSLLLHLWRFKWLEIKKQLNCVREKDVEIQKISLSAFMRTESTSFRLRSKIIGQNEDKRKTDNTINVKCCFPLVSLLIKDVIVLQEFWGGLKSARGCWDFTWYGMRYLNKSKCNVNSTKNQQNSFTTVYALCNASVFWPLYCIWLT